MPAGPAEKPSDIPSVVDSAHGPRAISYPVDLLATVDASVHPGWKLEDGVLHSPTEEKGRGLVFPFDLPQEYVLETVIQAAGPHVAFTFQLAFGAGRRIEWRFDKAEQGAWHSRIVGLDPSAASDAANVLDVARERPITGDRERHHLVLRMAIDNLEAFVDGERVLHWRGDPSQPGSDGPQFDNLETYNGARLQGRAGFWCWEAGLVRQLTLHPPNWTPPVAIPTRTVAAAEPAPAASAPSAETPPSEADAKIAELTADFRKRFADGPGAFCSDQIAKLNTSYAGALDRESKKLAAAGDLDAVLAFRNEADALRALAGNSPSLPALAPGAPPALASMRQTYRDTVARHEQKRDADAAPLLGEFDRTLETLVVDFTRSGKIEAALRIREFRAQLRAEGASLLSGATFLADIGWISLFNGKDLDGWTVAGDPASFQVTPEGELMLRDEPGYLYYTGTAQGGAFTDFEFKARVRTLDNANSGIYFHVPVSTGASHPVQGYEVQIHNGDLDPRKTGSLYAVVDVATSPVRDDEWFELGIRVEGKIVTSTINGEKIVEWTEPEDWNGIPGNPARRLGAGTIAIQRNSRSGILLFFKDIRIRLLRRPA